MKTLLDELKDHGKVVDELYVKCLSRKPTATEKANLLAAVNGEEDKNKQTALEDVFWALLNSKEFIFNH